MSERAVLHVKGRVLVGPDDVRDELWVVGGRISYDRPVGAHDVRTVEGWALPGLVDAHCHVGLGAHGPVGDDVAEKQALADRDIGTLLIRDAGSPSDTRWVDDREDLPKIIRAGRHIARTRRYIRGYAHEIEPEDLVAYVAQEARRGDGWVKLVGDWIDRDLGDLAPTWPREAVEAGIAEAHRLGARVTAHCFAEDSLKDLVEAGIDCIEHATGLNDDLIPLFAERGVAIVPTLVNIATFPKLADGGEEKYPAGRPICAGSTNAATTRSAPPTTPASRSSSAPTRAAPCRTASRRPRWRNWSPPASPPSTPSRRRPGRPGPGSAARDLRREPRRTSWCTSPTRARTSASWRRPAGSCSTGGSSANRPPAPRTPAGRPGSCRRRARHRRTPRCG